MRRTRRSTLINLTFSALIAALYFVLCLAEGSFASGYLTNVRFAEGLCVLAFFCPEIILGTSLGCFLYNFFFGFGIIDALIGTTATLLGTLFIYVIGKFIKNDIVRVIVFGLMLVLLNAFLVPVVLIVSLPDDLSWAMYWSEFLIVMSGEALACYSVGVPLYFATFKWLPNILNKR